MTLLTSKKVENKSVNRQKYEAFFEEEKGAVKILSPEVGMFEAMFRTGDILYPGSHFGNLSIMGSIFRVYLPDHVSGVVESEENKLLIFPVGYKTHILSLRTQGEVSRKEKNKQQIRKINKSENNEIVIKAFTTGIFYTRPSPESPPFISPGSVIKRGSVLGLIEVMKSFNQIIFTGEGEYEKGKVKKVLEKDSSEVSIGDPLFLISVDQGGNIEF